MTALLRRGVMVQVLWVVVGTLDGEQLTDEVASGVAVTVTLVLVRPLLTVYTFEVAGAV